ncbi:MAG: rhodanese-like domain-containing protein [Candidatus Hatepunaea meridiana]|nr:rhodanese-like domain-containing protein [Candidatus Hatepunaea meridiana]
MAPLAPDIIGNELNLMIALIIGIAFGFILEQAGFSSSRKLAGLFYGYDFVVLRVFFTAAITAASGIVLLSHFGLLNIDLIYINPTFLSSAIIGGIIMGAGFIIGGFCPGTSVCGAAIGKIDAMVFILGTFLGVFFFTEGYPLFKNLYTANNLGSPFVFDSLGISRGLFAFLLVTGAVGAFIATTVIENKVNKRKVEKPFLKNYRYSILTAITILIGFILIFLPDQKTKALAVVADKNWVIEDQTIQTITIDELALRLTERDRKIQLIDVRSTNDFNADNIPTAINIPLDSLANVEWRDLLTQSNKDNIFYCKGQLMSSKAAVLSRLLGDNPVNYVLEGGLQDFNHNIMDIQETELSGSNQELDTYRFRKNVREKLLILKKEAKKEPVIRKKPKKVQGGC